MAKVDSEDVHKQMVFFGVWFFVLGTVLVQV